MENERIRLKTGHKVGLILVAVLLICFALGAMACSIVTIVWTKAYYRDCYYEIYYSYYHNYYPTPPPYHYHPDIRYECGYGTYLFRFSLTAQGIWTGVMVLISGSLNIRFANKPTKQTGAISAGFSLFSFLLSMVMISLESCAVVDQYYYYGSYYGYNSYWYTYDIWAIHCGLLSAACCFFVFTMTNMIISYVATGCYGCCCYSKQRSVAPFGRLDDMGRVIANQVGLPTVSSQVGVPFNPQGTVLQSTMAGVVGTPPQQFVMSPFSGTPAEIGNPRLSLPVQSMMSGTTGENMHQHIGGQMMNADPATSVSQQRSGMSRSVLPPIVATTGEVGQSVAGVLPGTVPTHSVITRAEQVNDLAPGNVTAQTKLARPIYPSLIQHEPIQRAAAQKLQHVVSPDSPELKKQIVRNPNTLSYNLSDDERANTYVNTPAKITLVTSEIKDAPNKFDSTIHHDHNDSAPSSSTKPVTRLPHISSIPLTSLKNNDASSFSTPPEVSGLKPGLDDQIYASLEPADSHHPEKAQRQHSEIPFNPKGDRPLVQS